MQFPNKAYLEWLRKFYPPGMQEFEEAGDLKFTCQRLTSCF